MATVAQLAPRLTRSRFKLQAFYFYYHLNDVSQIPDGCQAWLETNPVPELAKRLL